MLELRNFKSSKPDDVRRGVKFYNIFIGINADVLATITESNEAIKYKSHKKGF